MNGFCLFNPRNESLFKKKASFIHLQVKSHDQLLDKL